MTSTAQQETNKFEILDHRMAVFQNEAISKVAREFDLMFGRLLQFLGCAVPDVLREPTN